MKLKTKLLNKIENNGKILLQTHSSLFLFYILRQMGVEATKQKQNEETDTEMDENRKTETIDNCIWHRTLQMRKYGVILLTHQFYSVNGAHLPCNH